jgi:hypothetical protein
MIRVILTEAGPWTVPDDWKEGEPLPNQGPIPSRLGDVISQALALIGITEKKVSDWLGKPCGCAERREKLNALGAWANRILSGKVEKALEYFDQMTAIK